MDPKMDSGYLADGDTLDENYDVLRELLPEEIIGIMDQMLCYEVHFPQWLQCTRTETVLILIPGIVDGMAHGISAVTIAFHLPLYRQIALAGA